MIRKFTNLCVESAGNSVSIDLIIDSKYVKTRLISRIINRTNSSYLNIHGKRALTVIWMGM